MPTATPKPSPTNPAPVRTNYPMQGGPTPITPGDPTQMKEPGPMPVQSAPSPGKSAPAPLPPQPIHSSGTLPQNTGPLKGLTTDQVKNYWIQAGGNPQAADMAAAVADAESGLNAAAQRTNPDGTTSIGLWLIPKNGTPPGSTDPLANARAAVQLSQNGTDWTQWCSTWSDNNCGENNGTYLGQGANALMSLQTGGSAQYNVFGSTAAGNGVGASSATSGTGLTGGTNTSSSSFTLIILLIIVVVVIVYFVRRRQREGQTATATTEVEQSE